MDWVYCFRRMKIAWVYSYCLGNSDMMRMSYSKMEKL